MYSRYKKVEISKTISLRTNIEVKNKTRYVKVRYKRARETIEPDMSKPDTNE